MDVDLFGGRLPLNGSLRAAMLATTHAFVPPRTLESPNCAEMVSTVTDYEDQIKGGAATHEGTNRKSCSILRVSLTKNHAPVHVSDRVDIYIRVGTYSSIR